MGSYCEFSRYDLLFLIILFYFVVSGENSIQLASDQASLLAFKAGIVVNPKHALETWNAHGARVCNWLGVHCNKRIGRVVEWLFSTWYHFPSLSNLSSLKILDLSNNSFEGFIPQELGTLFQLQRISLAYNLLEGNIPSQFGSQHQLLYVDLGSNKLTGEILLQFLCNGSFEVEYIDLSNNSLSANLTCLQELELAGNQLGGELSSIIGHLSYNLLKIRLDDNNIHGRIPAEISNLVNLNNLNLSNNFLNGSIPAELFQMQKLESLNLANNSLSGSIPSEFG
ncbi:hypothetical protein ACH5RR_003615 [Cinchona calisaya]|uniref:Leucine-rich repeat-containing N-terminal plant-type domain-containing protein n=1 Tax=Cinchona calisaya TaxID=153742 RepID=A0ABD3AVA4_9GENT